MADFSIVQTFAFEVEMMSAICCWVIPCFQIPEYFHLAIGEKPILHNYPFHLGT